MGYLLTQIFAFSIIIPAIIGWVRFSKLNSAFIPFLLFIWLGTLNEIANYIIIFILHQYNIFNYNLFLLVEALLIIWQFERWYLFGHNKKISVFLHCFLVCIWLLENLFISKFYLGFNSYFRIISSFMIVLMSIGMLNQVIVKERKSLIKNPVFIICSFLVVLFTYALLTESFIIYGVKMSDSFSTNLFRIFTIANLIANLAYGLAIWLIPRRQAFALQY